MQSRSQLSRLGVYLLAPLWVAHAAVYAEPSQSLAERRLGLIKGTTSGIVLFDFGSAAPRTAASAPAGDKTTGQAQASETKATAAAQEPAIGNQLLNALPPPTGRSLQSARRLDAPDQGVTLRTSRDVPQTEPAAKR